MSSNKIKIAFVLPSLGAGGAERIMSFIAQNINTHFFEPTLVIITNESETSYKINKVPVFYLNKSRVLFSVYSLYAFFKKHKPDVVMSSIVHLNVMVAIISMWFPRIKFIGREASVLTEMNKFEPSYPFNFQKNIIRFTYRLLDVLVCQSKDMSLDLIENFNVPEYKIELINNPITRITHIKTKKEVKKPISFISISRLSREKGLDRMISILSKLDFPFTFTIIGNGPEKDNIIKLLEDNDLTTNTSHIPFTEEVDTYLANTDVFLQTSYVDGFPNAVVESCSVGTPVIALKAPGGISEIIEDGENGYIVTSNEAFIDCLTKINNDFPFLPEIVSKVVLDRFNKKLIIDKYECLFIKVMKQ